MEDTNFFRYLKENTNDDAYKFALEYLSSKYSVMYVSNFKEKSFENKLVFLNERVVREREKEKTEKTDKTTKFVSGFCAPVYLSDEMCNFLGITRDKKISRPELTRLISKYIKDNNLQRQDDKRCINIHCNEANTLKNLLKVPDFETLTFFSLQIYLKCHIRTNLLL